MPFVYWLKLSVREKEYMEAARSTGSRALRSYSNQAIFPAITLAITMSAFNVPGNGLRDALERRLRRTEE